jgi:hypothetical protein
VRFTAQFADEAYRLLNTPRASNRSPPLKALLPSQQKTVVIEYISDSESSTKAKDKVFDSAGSSPRDTDSSIDEPSQELQKQNEVEEAVKLLVERFKRLKPPPSKFWKDGPFLHLSMDEFSFFMLWHLFNVLYPLFGSASCKTLTIGVLSAFLRFLGPYIWKHIKTGSC